MNTSLHTRINLSTPHMGGGEIDFVHRAFDENWIAPLGPNVNGFEDDLANYLEEDVFVAALSSGTSAIHLALILLGVQQEEEVICQSLTFSGTSNPIVYLGAKPVFVDSESDTWNMSPDFLKTAIEDRLSNGKHPKAIIFVDLFGMPCKINEILSIANEYEIPVIEDAAEALGSTYFDRKAGTFGKMAILSFNGNKIITTSGGGALVSNSASLIKRARYLATQARDAAPHYQHSQIGYNYRMSNICAGIGRGQMLVLQERVERKRNIFDQYRSFLGEIPGVSFQEEQKGMKSNRWLSTLLLDPEITPNHVNREDIRLCLEADNIESRPLWKPMHLQPVFENAPFYGDGTSERLFENGICMPSATNMSQNDWERIRNKTEQLFK